MVEPVWARATTQKVPLLRTCRKDGRTLFIITEYNTLTETTKHRFGSMIGSSNDICCNRLGCSGFCGSLVLLGESFTYKYVMEDAIAAIQAPQRHARRQLNFWSKAEKTGIPARVPSRAAILAEKMALSYCEARFGGW